MKERPILFSGEMVRAILDGRKTQTRRVMKLEPEYWNYFKYGQWPADKDGSQLKCPYGQPGDRLWVRHDFYKNIAAQDSYNEQIWNPYTKSVHWKVEDNRFENGHPEIADCIPNFECGYWKHTPSIHMPRWACRLILEITNIRVERLNDISNEDAIAEGTDLDPAFVHNGPANKMSRMYGAERCKGFASSVFAQRVWDPINGPGSWIKNPWVWVIEFKRVSA